jgi:hypothetical protein
MEHRFCCPRVVEIRQSGTIPSVRTARPVAGPTDQRRLVEASLMRCPDRAR